MEAATAASEAKKVKTEGEPQAQENGKKRKGRARKKESVDDSEDNDEEQEDCSAKPKCSRPVGKEVSILCTTFSQISILIFWISILLVLFEDMSSV